MLSTAKHLLFLMNTDKKQIPSPHSGQAFRLALDDMIVGVPVTCWLTGAD
jgi:hypothetical protein